MVHYGNWKATIQSDFFLFFWRSGNYILTINNCLITLQKAIAEFQHSWWLSFLHCIVFWLWPLKQNVWLRKIKRTRDPSQLIVKWRQSQRKQKADESQNREDKAAKLGWILEQIVLNVKTNVQLYKKKKKITVIYLNIEA